MTNHIKVSWTTQVTEHHSTTLPEDQLPAWVVDLLTDRESGIAEGEFIDPTDNDLAFLTDLEDPGTTLDHTSSEEQSYIYRVEVVPPTPAEVGYSTAEGMRVAEYRGNSQAGLASFRGEGVHRG